ncbi:MULTISPECIES: RNA recognition motif domain-containing protein [Niastella]|uniref:RRM domain-containing protein n=1 Tax=Niastella soli TaxID=2821487 RepID=A0ABS3Z3W9_9BACT|nr:hypothetical protein [Niastella soli]MBO9204340.1 hypothetical protein [Niastella soli]
MYLLITNLNRFATTSQVVALFFPFGFLTSAQIICNIENGFSTGEALVEIEFSAGQTAIKALNNLRFMNYFIKVEETF